MSIITFGQGKYLLEKRDGLRLSYDIQLAEVVENACMKDMKWSQGSRYKITCYLANESGKKLIYTGGYVPYVSFVSKNGCFDMCGINIDLPLNTGEIKQSSCYYTILNGTPENSIQPYEIMLRGYYFAGEKPKEKFYYVFGKHTAYWNGSYSEVFGTNCDLTNAVKREYIYSQFIDAYAKKYLELGEKINEVTYYGPFETYEQALFERDKVAKEGKTWHQSQGLKCDDLLIFKPSCIE